MNYWETPAYVAWEQRQELRTPCTCGQHITCSILNPPCCEDCPTVDDPAPMAEARSQMARGQ